MAKKKSAQKKQPSFEQALEQLESIVAQLEGGELGLAESLEQYEQGVKCLKSCYQQLSEAERRIALVGGVDASGRPRTEPFEEGNDESLETKGSARSKRRTAQKGRSSRGDVDDASTLF